MNCGGIPASSIDAGWCAVEELTPRHFEAFDGVHGRSVDEDAAGYAVRGPAVDWRPTRLVLVVYRVCGGETGTAMALLDGDARPRRVLAVEVITSPASYAMLDADTADRVRVVHCRECDDASEYRWDAQQRRFVPTTPTVDDPWARRP